MVKKSICRCRQCGRCRRSLFHLWVGNIPWSRKWHPTPVFLLGQSHGQRSLSGYSPLNHRESDTLNMNENFFSPLSPPVTGEEEVKTMDSSLIPLFPHILHLVHQQLCLHKRIWNPAPSSLILHKYQPAPSLTWMVVISLITNLCVFTVAALPPANKQVFLKHKSEHIIFLQGLPTAIRIRFKLLSFPKGSVRSGTLYAHRCSLPFSDHSGYCSLFPHTYSCLRDFSWVLSSTWQDLRLDFPRAASRDQGSG